MKIKKRDTVIVIAGKDKGKKGAVARAFPADKKIIIEGVNVLKKHQRANQQNRKGQIIEKAMPLHVSNVMLVDPKGGKPTRIKVTKENGERTRIAIKSGAKLN